jgi:hypothetical protein
VSDTVRVAACAEIKLGNHVGALNNDVSHALVFTCGGGATAHNSDIVKSRVQHERKK